MNGNCEDQNPVDYPYLESHFADYLSFYEENGYLVIPNWWSVSTCLDLKQKMDDILRDPSYRLEESQTIFTTNEQSRTSDDYFLGSGDKIRFFFEEKAFDEEKGDEEPEVDEGKISNKKTEVVTSKREKHLCVNKVGHGLHDLDSTFQSVTYDERVGYLAHTVGKLMEPLAAQSMYIFKQPKIGGEVSPHQDGTFLYTEPQSVVGFWWALEDCTLTNGCLWAVPGSHRLPVRKRFKRKSNGEIGTEFEFKNAEDEKKEMTKASQENSNGAEFDLTGAVPLEVKAGTLVLLHHALVHYSAPNTSSKSRHAYSVHVIEGADGTTYLPDNWLQRESPFNPLPIPSPSSAP